MFGLLERLQDLTRDQNFASFRCGQTIQDAACMNLLRLGEGTKFVPEAVQSAHPELPWAELRGVRNLPAHDSFGLDLARLWYTPTVELPSMRAKLKAMLDAAKGEEQP